MAGTPTRRVFLRFAPILPVAALAACRRPAPTPDEELTSLLQLRDGEKEWLASIREADRRELQAVLASGGDARQTRRAQDLLLRVIGPRDHLYAYVGYPKVPRRRSACDGLLRE